MAVIKLRSNTIDIPVEDSNGKELMVLKFDRSDAKKKDFEKTFDKVMKIVEKAENITNAQIEKVIKESMNVLFGEGTYEQFYTYNPSVDIVALYLYEAAIIIKEQLEQEDLKAIESKYFNV